MLDLVILAVKESRQAKVVALVIFNTKPLEQLENTWIAQHHHTKSQQSRITARCG